MSQDIICIDIKDNDINVSLGQDSFCSNLLSDKINVKLLDNILEIFQKNETFQSCIDGFISSSDFSVFASYFVFNEIPSGEKNGINTQYQLAFAPFYDKALVYLNGLLQAPLFDYTLNGQNLTFLKPLKSQHDLYVSYIKIN